MGLGQSSTLRGLSWPLITRRDGALRDGDEPTRSPAQAKRASQQPTRRPIQSQPPHDLQPTPSQIVFQLPFGIDVQVHTRQPAVGIHTVTELPLLVAERTPPIRNASTHSPWITDPCSSIVHVDDECSSWPQRARHMTDHFLPMLPPLHHPQRTVKAVRQIDSSRLQELKLHKIGPHQADPGGYLAR